MRQTHRRLNLLQAWKRAGGGWLSLHALAQAGAYGSRQSMRRALQKLTPHDAVLITKDRVHGHLYRFTPRGMVLLGMIPEKSVDPPHDS